MKFRNMNPMEHQAYLAGQMDILEKQLKQMDKKGYGKQS